MQSPLMDVSGSDAKGKGSRRVEYTRATVLQSAADEPARADYVAAAWAKIRGFSTPVRGVEPGMEHSSGVSSSPIFSEGDK